MIKNIKSIYQNLNKKKLIILFCFTVTFFSISSSFQHLEISNFDSKILLSQLINFFRVILNLVCFLILTIMCIKFIKVKRINILFIFFFLFFLFQIPGTIYIQNNYENLLLIISAFNIIFILMLAIEEFNSKELRIFLYLLSAFLTIILSINFANDLYSYFFFDSTRFYGRINNYFDAIQIRSSGSSRMALILLIIYSTLLMEYVKLKWIKFLPIIIFATLIFLYQSRASILLLFIFVVINILHMKKPVFRSILIYILIPKILFFVLPAIQSSLFIYNEIEGRNLFSLNKNFLKDFKVKSDRFQRKKNNEQFTSGRKNDWIEIYKSFNYKKNLYLGYGSQGDRYLINRTASNGLIYAFVSSGLLGLLLYSSLSLYALFLVFKYYFINNKKDNLIHCCSIIILLILIRSLVESSHAHFGIDYILISLCTCILIRNDKLYKYDLFK
jgi:hypothetical protein